MKITIEVVGSVFRVEIDNQPETANETMGGLPVAAASGTAERTGRTSVYTRTGRHGTPHVSGVTAGETATNSDGGLNIVTKHTEIFEPAPAPKVSVLRPHCRHKDACGGYGFNHCHGCLRGANAEGSAA